MHSPSHEAPSAPSEPAPSVPPANTETPVNAPGPIVVDDFHDVCRLESASLIVTWDLNSRHLVGPQQ